MEFFQHLWYHVIHKLVEIKKDQNTKMNNKFVWAVIIVLVVVGYYMYSKPVAEVKLDDQQTTTDTSEVATSTSDVSDVTASTSAAY